MRLLPILLLAALAIAGEPPRLIVVISVDQLRPDTLQRFEKEYRGAFHELLAGSYRFDGILDHAATQTGPGHSTMLTGCRPARTGIIANTWVNRRTLRPVYCVADATAPVYGARSPKGRSPRLCLRDTLGDWLKAQRPGAKVYSVSAKDRSAILMGGRAPDGAYWLEKSGIGFTTSSYYHLGGLPDWLGEFNHDGWLDRLPAAWTYEPVSWLRRDDDARESERYSRASPHPLKASKRAQTLDRLYCTPYIDEWTLRLAAEVARRFELGKDDVPDLLCISLSATDTVGHLYGPFSQEIRDSMLRLDRNLEVFFDYLEHNLGVHYVVALTADHGVLPLTAAKRVNARAVLQRVATRTGRSDLYRFAGGQLFYVAPDAPKGFLATLAAAVREEESTAAVYTRAQLEGTGGGEMMGLARNSYHPDRSGDLVVFAKENVLFDLYGTGTNHGSPYRYDRAVPLLFWGPGIEPGQGGAARTIDLAPTLARLIGVRAPEDLDGRALDLPGSR